MQNKFAKNEEIKFKLPYLDGILKFYGSIVLVKPKSLLVEYKTSLGENENSRVKILLAEIPYDFIIDK